ncbi:cytochrome P450 [Streptomyces sp. NPDC060194]|uniref:cytochrome P450 n=1 Tax=Streptomyces sp. NPDC060194 TaxID=3347069 RepID=UPI003659BADB
MAVETGAEGAAVVVDGPRGVPLLGSLPEFGKDPLGFFTRLRDRGDVVRWRFGRRESVFVSHPDAIGELLTGAETRFERNDLGIAFRTLLGDGVVVATGAEWRRKRSLVQPSVRPKQVKAYAATMVECAVDVADRWQDGARIDVRAEMSALTQRVAVRTIFGVDTEADSTAIARAMDVAQEEIGAEFSGLGAVLPDWVRTPGRARIRRAARVIDREVARIVARHEASDAAERPDLLSRLLVAQDENGVRLSAREIRDETVTLYIGGHETTAGTLVWAWYLLSRNPRVRAALADELTAVLGSREPGFDDYARLPYTQAIVKETLRLYPTIWLMTGRSAPGTTIAGVPLAPGTRVWSSQWATQRDARYFTEPEEFRPERWATDTVHEYAWFPFGGGPRVCLGARFAMVEAVLVLAVLARRFDITVSGDIRPVPKLTLQPDGDVWGTLHSR